MSNWYNVVMENTSKAQKETILYDWRNKFTPSELKLFIYQLNSLIELVQLETTYYIVESTSEQKRLFQILLTANENYVTYLQSCISELSEHENSKEQK